MGHRITIYREPTWDRSIYSETPFWDIDRLFELMPSTLAAGPLDPPGGWREDPMGAPAAAPAAGS